MWELWTGLLMLLSEVMDVGNNTLSKAAMATGMSTWIFITYTHVIAVLFLIPVAFFVHRRTAVPSITLSILWRLILLGVVCYGISAFLFIGIKCSSPTLASAMTNLSPAFTFILAIIFRMEKLNLRSWSSQLKILGTVVSITGAFVVIFYKGLPITIFPAQGSSLLSIGESQPNWIMGGFFLATSSILLSMMYIIKTSLARDFPSEVLITLMSFFFETIVAVPVALIAEKDASVWLPSLDIKLIAIAFGAMEIGLVNVVHTWACGKKGPVYVVMFKPLQIIIAAIMGVSFLKEVLHIGSVIGGITIAIGFYTVMKGKAEESMSQAGVSNIASNNNSSSSVDHKIPFLSTNTNTADV